MSVHIHFRTDNWHFAQCKFKGTPRQEAWKDISQADYDAIPLPVPGDIWRITWYKEGGGPGGPFAGYAICCPKCGDIHQWTTATNCAFQPTSHSYKSTDGSEKSYKTCGHSGKASCWDWGGSAEEGTLTANPSLLCHTCGYHGWLRNGELTEC